MTSFWAETTATSGRSSSSSVRPSALRRLRCGARASPRLIMSLLSSTFPLAFSCWCEKCEAWPRSRYGGRRHAVLLGALAGVARRAARRFSRAARGSLRGRPARVLTLPARCGTDAAAVGRMRPVLALSSHLLSGDTLRWPCFRRVIARERYRFHGRAVACALMAQRWSVAARD